MKHFKLISIILIASLITSCASRKGLQGNYDKKVIETVDGGYDDIWSEIIDFFTEEGVTINVIDKESGLITTRPVDFVNFYCVENDTKFPSKNSSYVVLENYPAGLFGKPIPHEIIGTWNVRIKKVRDNQTSVNVNLNLKSITGIIAEGTQYQRRIQMQGASTGKFEEQMINILSLNYQISESDKVMNEALANAKPQMKTDYEMTQEQNTPEVEYVTIIDTVYQIDDTALNNLRSKLIDATNQITQLQSKINIQEKEKSRTEKELSQAHEIIADLQEDKSRTESLISDVARASNSSAERSSNYRTNVSSANTQVNYSGPDYRVQIAASSRAIPIGYQVRELGQIIEEPVPGKALTRYQIGNFQSKADAVSAQRVARQNGFPDAYIVTR